MKKRIKVAIVTGTRADYYLLRPLIEKISKNPRFDFGLLVTGAHLSQEHGYTYQAIQSDTYRVWDTIDLELSKNDSTLDITQALGKCVIGFAKAYAEIKPDLVIILGDRYESLAAAQAALLAQVTIAHIFGGDLTLGAYDDAIRHSITKMAHIHFPTNKISEKRLWQLGENPKNVFNVGSLAFDALRSTALLSKKDLEKTINFTFQERNLLITYHKETLSSLSGEAQITILLEALQNKEFKNWGLLFTYPNADNDGQKIKSKIENFIKHHAHAKIYDSLGHKNYFSAIKQVNAVVGNSSSGVLEVPFLGTATVNIGNRQGGRFLPPSIIQCTLNAKKIVQAIQKSTKANFSRKIKFKNPYGDGHTAERIIKILLRERPWLKERSKVFFNLQ